MCSMQSQRRDSNTSLYRMPNCKNPLFLSPWPVMFYDMQFNSMPHGSKLFYIQKQNTRNHIVKQNERELPDPGVYVVKLIKYTLDILMSWDYTSEKNSRENSWDTPPSFCESKF